MDDARARIDPDLERHDARYALGHELDRQAPSRHAQWPKQDERSSRRVGGPHDHLTEAERASHWPLG